MTARVTRLGVLWAAWLAVCWWAFLLYSYPTWDVVHIAAGGGAGLAGATAATVAHAKGLLGARFGPDAVRRTVRLPLEVARDSVLVIAELGRCALERRRPEGTLRRVPVSDSGRKPQRVGRRAALAILGSTAPNSVVAAIGDDELLLHELVPRGDAGA